MITNVRKIVIIMTSANVKNVISAIVKKKK